MGYRLTTERSDGGSEAGPGVGHEAVEVVIGAVDGVLEVEHLAEYHEVEDAEGEPSEEDGEEVGGYLKTLRAAADCEISVAPADPFAEPHDGVYAQGDDGEYDVEEQAGGVTSVLATGKVGFFGEGVDEIPLVKA